MSWLKKLVDSSDPTASMRSCAYGLVILCSLGWLTRGVLKLGITTEWNVAFGLLLAAVSATKVMESK